MTVKIRHRISEATWIEFDASTQKEAFEQLAKYSEVFGIRACGCCQSHDIRFVVRENEGFQFYELRCNECHAKLEFGQRREGGELFPKRRDEAGNYKKHGGWYVYRSDDQRQHDQGGAGESEFPSETPF